jgi:hypothetical protein
VFTEQRNFQKGEEAEALKYAVDYRKMMKEEMMKVRETPAKWRGE